MTPEINFAMPVPNKNAAARWWNTSGESHLWKDSAYYDEVDKRQGQRAHGDGFKRVEFINARHFELRIS